MEKSPAASIPRHKIEQHSGASLTPECVSVLAALWSRSEPITARQLAMLAGISRTCVDEVLIELRACGLIRTLNTVIESYLASGAPSNPV
jgi:DNA-binding MarR family transcriptional regulator